MPPQNNPDRIRRTIAWWPMPACSCRHPRPDLGLRELVDHHLDLGGAQNTDKMDAGRFRAGGGDCIDDADALRAGGVLGCVVKAPGTFLRSFGMSVNSMSRVVGPGLGWGRTRRPLTIDLDSCETWTGQGGSAPPAIARGYHIAAGTGEVLKGRGPWRRPLPAETVGRVRLGPGDNSRCGPRGFYDCRCRLRNGWLLYHHPPASGT